MRIDHDVYQALGLGVLALLAASMLRQEPAPVPESQPAQFRTGGFMYADPRVPELQREVAELRTQSRRAGPDRTYSTAYPEGNTGLAAVNVSTISGDVVSVLDALDSVALDVDELEAVLESVAFPLCTFGFGEDDAAIAVTCGTE
jgi:hypothetical protein